ncbi:MAG: InlB B-repeat-containing protein [Lachnospiraceae bacterium]|nr:InlB B-repeat-containing protein [Lachnospiraceae bacterium]
MEMKRRIAIVMVFLMIVSIIDFSGFLPVSASTLNEGTVIMEETDVTPSEDSIQMDTVSTPEIKEQKEDSVSSQELEDSTAKESEDLEEQTTAGESEGITYSLVDGIDGIYANGNAITIKKASVSTSLIYLDSEPNTPVEIEGLVGNISDGYNLEKCSIFGGSETASVSSTSVTMLGVSVNMIFGGGYSGSVEGDTNVTISGNEMVSAVVYGGSALGDVDGNTNVTINGGKIESNVYGGAYTGIVKGNTSVTINGGKIESNVYGGGCSDVQGSTNVTINGGEIVSVYGGGSYSTVKGTALVKKGVDATVFLITAGSDKSSAVGEGSHVEYEVAFYDGTTKLTNLNSVLKPQWVTEGDKAVQPDSDPFHIGKIIRECKDKDGIVFDFNSSITEAEKVFIDWGYTVSYNGNGYDGGTLPVDNHIYSISDNVTVSGNTGNLARNGYTFGGWSISQNGTPITQYTVGLEPMTFYAVWTPTVTVINGTGSGSYTEGETVTITAEKRIGNTFEWTSNDDVTFADSKAYTTTFLMPNKPVTVSANYSTNDHYLIDKDTATAEFGDADKKGYATITLKKTNYVYTGSEIRPVPVVRFTYTEYDDTGKQTGKAKTKKLVENVDYTLSYANNSNVGTVLSLGKILITGIGDYKDTMTKEFTITSKSIKSAVMEPIEDVQATGADFTAQVSERIIVKDGVNTISKNDYDIHYEINNQEPPALPGIVDAKTVVKVSVTGKNNYKDTIKKTQTFTILPQNSTATSVADFELTVKVPKKGYTYSGKAMKPKITVTSTKGTKVKLNKDYKISYQNNVNAGTGTIVVSGKNNFYGSKSETFTIKQKDISKVKVKALSKIAHRETIEDLELTIKDGKRYLKKGVDYTVDFSSSKDLSLGVLKIKKVTLSVNALENSNYTGKKEVTCYIIPRSLKNKITTKIECPNVSYSDSIKTDGAKPELIIHYNGDKLEIDKDYKVTYSNNKKVGTGKAVIQGIGNYTGKRTVKFKITE